MRKFIISGVCLGLLVFFALACCPPSASKLGTNSVSPQPSQTTPSTNGTQSTNQEFKVGDQIKLGDRLVTIGAVTRNYVSSNEYMKPQEGKEWIVVPVVIENKGSQAVAFSSSDFKIQDSKGGRTYPTFIMDLQNEMKFGEIAPGGKIEGNIPFEVTAGEVPLKLVFKPMWGLAGEVLISL